MSKIVITPELVKESIGSRLIPSVSFLHRKISFNAGAVKMLGLKMHSYFLLELEDDKLYYGDSAQTGFEINGLVKSTSALTCNMAVLSFLKYKGLVQKTDMHKKFTIDGEIKNGRRLLNAMPNKK